MTETPAPPPVAPLLRGVACDFGRCWKALVGYEALFKVATTFVFVPLGAWLLAQLLAMTGHTAVSNSDILSFLETPVGVVCAVVLGLAVLTASLLEQAGMMAIVAFKRSGQKLTFRGGLLTVAAAGERIVRLGLVKLMALVLVFTPFALVAGLTYLVLVAHHDVNYYLAERPTEFYLAAGGGAVLALAALALAAVLYVRWSLALPILLFEEGLATRALRESARRVRGARMRIGVLLLGWQGLGFLLGLGLLPLCKLLGGTCLAVCGASTAVVIPLVVALLGLHGLLFAALHFFLVAVHSLLVLRLYDNRTARLGTEPPDGAPERLPARVAWAAGLTCMSLVPFVVFSWFSVAGWGGGNEQVLVTGHRGYSKSAPENTVSAVRKAAAVGADYAEIDVQETSDGEVVLLHDDDLARVGGVPKRIGEVSFADVRKIDVGSRVGPEYAGERIPTLREVIAEARGKIKLNIELKFYGKDRRLAEKVARIIRDEDFESQCVVMSLVYDGVLEAKRHNPGLRTGVIVAYALGDLTLLDVDVLSVEKGLVTDKLLRSARRAGKEVHVWTVNDPKQMTKLIEQGVTSIITDDPETLVRLRQERASLTDRDRLLLGSRYLLGLEP